MRKRMPKRWSSSASARPTGPAPAINTSRSSSTAPSHHDCAEPTTSRLVAVITMRPHAQPHFDFAELVANPIDLRMNAETIQRPAAQFVIQAVAIAQEARIFPASLAADPVAAELRFHPGEHDVELVQLRTELAVIAVTLVVFTPIITAVIPAIVTAGSAFRREAETSQPCQGERGNQN